MKNIVILSGYWSTNVGNSFFQLGAEYILKKNFPEYNIMFIGDEQGYIYTKKGNPKNSYNPLLNMSIDYLIILGPFIRSEFFKILAPTLEHFFKKGTKIVALGVGMMDYNNLNKSILNFFEKYPLSMLTTRDELTYKKLKPIISNIYNGIDLGFFVSDYYNFDNNYIGNKYITLNFDQIPEPDFIKIEECNHQIEKNIKIGDYYYSIKFNPLRKKISSKGFPFQIFDQIFFNQSKKILLDDFQIIRTDHRYNPVFLNKIYNSPNTYSGDVPFSYLQIYKNTEYTFSNRVHACVATLAFGNKAMLFSNTSRASLLDRVKAYDIKNFPVSIEKEYLEFEKQKLIEFIKNNWI